MRLPVSASQTPANSDVVDADLLLAVKLHLTDLRVRRRPEAAGQRAWEQFYFICDPLLRAYVAAAGVAPNERADCLQEAWLRLVRELPQFDFDPRRAPFTAWLRVLARNTAIDRMRRAAQWAATSGSATLQEHAPGAPSAEESNVQTMENRELAYQILQKLARNVTTTNYRIARQRWVDGQTVTEIAAKAGLTAHQVSARLYRMKKLLREQEAAAAPAAGPPSRLTR